MNYFKQFSNRPAYGYKTCGGVTLTIQNQVESIQSMLNRATQGFPISRKNVIYGMDENIQPMVDDLTDYDSLRHEMEYYKKKAETQKELNSRKEADENEEK